MAVCGGGWLSVVAVVSTKCVCLSLGGSRVHHHKDTKKARKRRQEEIDTASKQLKHLLHRSLGICLKKDETKKLQVLNK